MWTVQVLQERERDTFAEQNGELIAQTPACAVPINYGIVLHYTGENTLAPVTFRNSHSQLAVSHHRQLQAQNCLTSADTDG